MDINIFKIKQELRDKWKVPEKIYEFEEKWNERAKTLLEDLSEIVELKNEELLVIVEESIDRWFRQYLNDYQYRKEQGLRALGLIEIARNAISTKSHTFLSPEELEIFHYLLKKDKIIVERSVSFDAILTNRAKDKSFPAKLTFELVSGRLGQRIYLSPIEHWFLIIEEKTKEAIHRQEKLIAKYLPKRRNMRWKIDHLEKTDKADRKIISQYISSDSIDEIFTVGVKLLLKIKETPDFLASVAEHNAGIIELQKVRTVKEVLKKLLGYIKNPETEEITVVIDSLSYFCRPDILMCQPYASPGIPGELENGKQIRENLKKRLKAENLLYREIISEKKFIDLFFQKDEKDVFCAQSVIFAMEKTIEELKILLENDNFWIFPVDNIVSLIIVILKPLNRCILASVGLNQKEETEHWFSQQESINIFSDIADHIVSKNPYANISKRLISKRLIPKEEYIEWKEVRDKYVDEMKEWLRKIEIQVKRKLDKEKEMHQCAIELFESQRKKAKSASLYYVNENKNNITLEFFNSSWINVSRQMLFCTKIVEGKLYIPFRSPYFHDADKKAHYFDCQVKDGILYARFSLLDGTAYGYTVFLPISSDVIVGGYWLSDLLKRIIDISENITDIRGFEKLFDDLAVPDTKTKIPFMTKFVWNRSDATFEIQEWMKKYFEYQRKNPDSATVPSKFL